MLKGRAVVIRQLIGELASGREYISLYKAEARLRALPEGDGHRVIVAPGLLASDRSTFLLRRFLRSKGYDAQTWGSGRNLGSVEQLDKFASEVVQRAAQSAEPVSLIGWSLGGIAARYAAHLQPASVRQVITLGTPFLRDPRTLPIFPLYQAVSGVRRADFTDERLHAVASTPLVPSTSIVSIDDRVAPPADGFQLPGPKSETVEVRGSHSGLVRNPDVWRVVADRLRQPPGCWTPFVAPSNP